MSRDSLRRWSRLGALLLALGLVAASALESAPESEAPPRGLVEIDPNQSMWWTWLHGDASIVANVGPFVYGPSGGGDQDWVRRWVLMIHLPNTHEPLSCVQGFFARDDAEPIGVTGATFQVRLRPVAGMVWADVAHPDDVVAEIAGIAGAEVSGR